MFQMRTPQQIANLHRWVNALRSGTYKRTTRILRKGRDPNASYCCLGVACDTFKSELGLEWKESFSAFEYFCMDGISTLLPGSVQDLLGIDRYGSLPVPVAIEDGLCKSLVDLNVCGKFTFDQIADVIESQLIRESDVQFE